MDISIPSEIVLENQFKYPREILFSSESPNAIKEYNSDKNKTFQDSSATKLLIDCYADSTDDDAEAKLNDLSSIKIQDRYAMPPLWLFHIIQFRTAQQQADETDTTDVFTLQELAETCSPRVKSTTTVKKYLNILEDANLITCTTIGRNKCYALSDGTLGPVFNAFSQDDDTDVSIELFDSTAPAQFPIGPSTNIVDTARTLFYDEVRAGGILLGLFVLYTGLYIAMITHGYPFVEGAIIQYSLTLMGLGGMFATGIGLLRRSAASLGLYRPMY